MNLTIAYVTSRKEPMFLWFFESLHRETGGNYDGIKVVVVDRLRTERFGNLSVIFDRPIVHVAPKPCVWQGPHRLTKADYFAQCNARNTALCLAPDGWIAMVDDLSVLMPGWLASVREAVKGGYIACGAYRKVNDMVVKDGDVISCTSLSNGIDSRMRHGLTRPVSCSGSWAFGCSLALPVETVLAVGGWPEALSDGLGYEDVAMGRMLENAGARFRYDTKMMTYESDELHGQLPVMRREDPCRGDTNAQPRDDMSHAMLRIVANLRYHPNYFGEEGIRGLRARVLKGEPFPVVQVPQHRWFDSKPLSELPEDVPAQEEVEL